MKKREIVSMAIFAGAVATLAYAMTGSVHRDPRKRPECQTRVFYPLLQGQPVEFIVTPDARRFMIASLAVHHGRVLERQQVSYGLQIEWVDPDNITVEKRTFYERSWFAPEQSSPPSLTPVTPHLVGEAARLADERFTFFPANLSAGGTLRLTALPDSGLVLVRLYYAAEATSPSERSRPPDHRAQHALSGKLHPVAWNDLDDVEVARLLHHRWVSASIRGRRGIEFSINAVQLCDVSIPFHDRPALSITLPPERATALNFQRPTQVLLSGDTGLSSLSAQCISDRLSPTAVQSPLELVDRAPLAGLGYTAGASVDVPAASPTSLILRNTSSQPVSFVASVETPASMTFFGDPALIPMRDVDERFADDDDVLIGPELRYLELHRVSSEDPEPLRYDVSSFGSRDPVRLRVRALTPQSFGEVERKISVTILDADDKPLYSSTRSVALRVTPFERALATPRPPREPPRRFRWVSEDTLLFVTNHARGHRLEVRSDRAALVSATAEGVPRGDARRYRLPYNSTRVRYGEGLSTTWHHILPTNYEELRSNQTMRLEAVVRLAPEVLDEDDGASGPSSYALLTPESQTQKDAGRLYLVRETEVRKRPIEYYCSFTRGAEQVYRFDKAAWEHSHGLLKTVLWAPPTALGSSFRVLLDNRVWQSGMIRARVTTGQRAAPNTAKRVTLQSEPGVRLWLQAHGRRWPCQAPHRVVKAFPLPAGTGASFVWHKTHYTRSILLTGFSSNSAFLDVRIDGGQPRFEIGLHAYATPSIWAAQLSATDVQAQQLVSPDAGLRRLSVNVRRIGGNIPMGKHRLTVKNLSPQSVDLRALLQIDAPPSERPDRPQWVRREALEVW